MNKIDRDMRVPSVSAEEFYNRVADADSRPVPAFLRESRPFEDERYEIPIDRFTSKAFHHLEVEKIWKRVWQVACREEEIPNVGDTLVYEVATLKFIIVRAAPDRIRAFANSCLHRGRQLVDCDGRRGELRCPFHGFAWDLDGRLKAIPGAWEFPQISDPDDWRLPEAQVGTWGGFVFINPDRNAGPLSDFLGDIGKQFERYPLEDRYIAGHARQVVPCNWKIAQEAFVEAFHVQATHPQLMPSLSTTDYKYDCYENYSRTVGVNFIPSVWLQYDASEQDMLDSVVDYRLDQERLLHAKEGESARKTMADMARQGYARVTGEPADHFSDSEMVDACFVSLFPNFHPWSFFARICYLFRPYKDDPDRSILDVYQLSAFNKKNGRPPAAKVHVLDEHDDWTKAPEIGVFLARIINQDAFNFAPLQEGMKASSTGVLSYSQYQESRIRHLHRLIDQWIERP